MKSIRKLLTSAVAIVTVLSMLLMTGCSTPKVAATINGVDYTTGEYLANLYSTFSEVYYNGQLYQYASYGMDPWEQTFPYGEGEEKVEMLLSDYIVKQSQDSMVRQQAVKVLMAQYGITVPQEDLDEFNKEMAETPESEMLAYGFSKEHYCSMYIAVNFEEQALFYGLYDEGGQREVPADEIRKFFDENYVAYKAIEISHTDAQGAALSDEDIKANKDMLGNYLADFETEGNMDKVIADYTNDTAEEGAEKAEALSGDTAEENANIKMLDAVTGDENIVKAVLSVEVGKAAIVEYTDENGTTYTALINRLDVEKAGGEGYFDKAHDGVLYGIKFEEFDTELQAKADSLEYSFNKRAVKMCDPKKFEEVASAAA